MRTHVPHLPPPPVTGDPFVALYADTHDITNGEVTEVRRISSHCTIEHIYRRLPSATDFEYFGYLTKSQIVYGLGCANWAPGIGGKSCVFHSHPTATVQADGPSALDVYGFLAWPMRRSITVGRDFIWWWDKDRTLINLIRRLLAWDRVNVVPRMAKLIKKEHFRELYAREALASVGFDTPQLRGHPKQWKKYLWKTLRLKTYLLDRTGLNHRNNV